MEKSWFLVANASEARIYEKNGHHRGLEVLKSFNHPQSRQKEADLITDGAGRYDGSGIGASQGDYESKTSAKDNEKDVFARELAKELDNGRTTNRYSRLIIVAAPQFHGLLNKHLNGHVKALVSRHVDKDYTRIRDLDMWDTIKPHLIPA